MKKILILLCLPLMTLGQNVNIPDANFKAYLVGNTAINTNGDTEIQLTEAAAFNGSIIFNAMNIADLTGIEYFAALTVLWCPNNPLTSLDVSGNTALTGLWCGSNQLTTLNVSQNIALTTLSCEYNQLTGLDVSNNTALTVLGCGNNQLTSLDVSNNINLWELSCEYNQLTTLDVGNNTALTVLWCPNNQLTSLDVSGNTALTSLHCVDNLLTTLDVSQNTALVNLYCRINQLTTLDVRNGNNINITNFDSRYNPNLTCINVNDSAWSTANWTNIDNQQYFSNNCSGTGIEEHTTNKELLRTIDILGRETTKNPLFYIYDDGTVEKRIVIE